MKRENVEWTKGAPGLRRASWLEPGFDCRTECKHEVKGEHGQSGDEWIYVVGDIKGTGALVLSVSTLYDRGDLVHEKRQQKEWKLHGSRRQLAEGSAVQLHTTFQTDVTSWLQGSEGRADCASVNGPCFTGDVAYLAARDFFADHGNIHNFIQPESFWRELEAKFIIAFEGARADRVDTRFVRCAACAGIGYTEKKGT